MVQDNGEPILKLPAKPIDFVEVEFSQDERNVCCFMHKRNGSTLT